MSKLSDENPPLISHPSVQEYEYSTTFFRIYSYVFLQYSSQKYISVPYNSTEHYSSSSILYLFVLLCTVTSIYSVVVYPFVCMYCVHRRCVGRKGSRKDRGRWRWTTLGPGCRYFLSSLIFVSPHGKTTQRQNQSRFVLARAVFCSWHY